MYDDFSADYDRFIDWPGRLAVEVPFIERELEKVEWIFFRFYDLEPAGTLTFNLVTLQRGPASSTGKEEDGGWSQRVTSTELWPQRQKELTQMLEAAGFRGITCWGDMQGTPFDAHRSPNLVITATCPASD